MANGVHVSELAGLVGHHLGYSSWHPVDQRRVDLFAEATGDDQWIHTDPERARFGPFGGTVAHGYLVLSMAGPLLGEVIRFDGVDVVVNYGVRAVRFLAPVPVGARLRAGAEVASVRDRPRGFVELGVKVTFQVEGGPATACVAETVTLLRPVVRG